MSVFNRRNALVGFVALKFASRALERRRRGKRGLGLRSGLAIGLGIVSFGVLAGLAAVYLRRRGGEPQRLEGYAVGEEEPGGTELEPEAAAEPIPATT
jgi:hypothetical protein